LLGTTGAGGAALTAIAWATDEKVDGHSAAASQLDESSSFMADLHDRNRPPARVTSIAAEGDLVVPALHSALDGAATNVLVPDRGLRAHEDLPGSPEATREIALAVAGRGPTCRDLDAGVTYAFGVSYIEDGLGAVAGFGALYLDYRRGGAAAPRPRRRREG